MRRYDPVKSIWVHVNKMVALNSNLDVEFDQQQEVGGFIKELLL